MIDYQYFEGGLTGEPEVRFTPNGNAVTTFTLAQSDSKKNDTGEWETTQNRYLRVNIWDNDRHTWSQALAGLDKGTKLVVRGKLVTRQWQDKDGNNRNQLEVQAVHAYVDPTAGTTNGNTQTNYNIGGNSINTQGNNNVWPTTDNNDEQPPF